MRRFIDITVSILALCLFLSGCAEGQTQTINPAPELYANLRSHEIGPVLFGTFDRLKSIGAEACYFAGGATPESFGSFHLSNFTGVAGLALTWSWSTPTTSILNRWIPNSYVRLGLAVSEDTAQQWGGGFVATAGVRIGPNSTVGKALHPISTAGALLVVYHFESGILERS